MDQGDGWIVASILGSLFKKRPGCAFSAFLGIAVLCLGWMLLSATKQEDLTFPVLGLALIVLVVVIRATRVLLRRWQGESEEAEEGVPEEESESPATNAAAIPPATAALDHNEEQRTEEQARTERPGFFTRAAPALLGSVGAGTTVLPLVCVVGITLPTASHNDAEAVGYLVGFGGLALTPVAAVLGALAGWIAASIRRARHPGTAVGLVALLAGVGAAVLVTALAFAAYARMCGWSSLCTK